MTVEPIKFRCPECNTLLGAAPHKVGGTVHCPKCRAALVVPEPVAEPIQAPPTAATDDPDPSRIFREMFRVDPPSGEFPDFAPADIRAITGFEQPGVTGSATLELSISKSIEMPRVEAPPPPPPNPPAPKRKPRREPAPEPKPAEESGFPMIRTEPVSLRPDRPKPSRPEPPTVLSPAPIPSPEIRVDPPPILPPIVEATPPVLPRITVEAPPVVPPGLPPIVADPPIRAEPALLDRPALSRRSDVTLPRTAVLVWSFFAVLALVLSFAAGLLAGHYVWIAKAAG